MNEKLRVILFQDHGVWLAQAIERDICVQAETLEELYGRFEVAVRLECEGVGNLDHIPSAPEHFHRMWDRKAGSYVPDFGDASKFELAMAA